MSLAYSRSLPPDADEDLVESTRKDVQENLSMMADQDDDPTTLADDVVVEVHREENEIKIVGRLDAEPTAHYLAEDYDPDQDPDDEFTFEPWRPEGVDA